MKNNTTEVIFILDRSGSMAPFTTDTIGGYNNLVREQKESGADVLITTVLFNCEPYTLCRRIPVGEVPEMTGREYRAYGSTALIDAVITTVNDILNTHTALDPEDVPKNKICFIATDGHENSSRCYTAETMKATIKHMEDNLGWKFFYLGADLNAVEDGVSLGFSRERSASHSQSERGHYEKFSAMKCAIEDISTGRYEEDPEFWKSKNR